MRDRLAAETEEEREARLQEMRVRLAAKNSQAKEARLQQMSTYQRERLAAETEAEREARLQQMSTYKRERLAAETEEEREVWLQCDRDTGINSLCSHSSHCLNSIPFKIRCISFMNTVCTIQDERIPMLRSSTTTGMTYI